MDKQSVFILFGVLIFVWIVFIPTYIAYYKKKQNRFAIFILNLFLGWTFVGFVVALVWSLTKEPEANKPT